ncbi:MAG: sulfatase [Verrucomicrobiae bacterium]|nr:sulfatase [Verrucomicrobiae bacterium]
MHRWLAALFAVISTGFARGDERPNILFIVSEDNGPELGCYGDPHARTPNLDQLAAEGVRFERAFVPYSVCSPSRAAFLTGLHPGQNGQIGLATHKFAMYREDTPNVISLLKPAGYRTGLIGKLHVNPESAFPFDFRAIAGANFQRKQDVGEYVAAAETFWAEAAGKPWFLSVNFPDAHLPFLREAHGLPDDPQNGEDVSPLPWVGADSQRLREVTADYYNCLARLDVWVGRLLDALEKTGRAGNTMVIYFGDHGAQFPRGKGTVYEGGLRVPLIVRWPGKARAGSVRNELTSTLDLLPTILEATGIEAPPELTGRALQPLLRGEKPADWRQYVFALTTGSFPRACYVQESVRDERYRLISSPRPGTRNLDAGTYLDPEHPHHVVSGLVSEERASVSPEVETAFRRWENPPRYELYDLESDPNEWENLTDDPDHAEAKARLVAALEAWQEQIRDPFSDRENVDAFVEEQLDYLDLRYRKQKDFRWRYLDTFPAWRKARAEP